MKKHVIISHEKNNNRIDAHWSDESSPRKIHRFILNKSWENYVSPKNVWDGRKTDICNYRVASLLKTIFLPSDGQICKSFWKTIKIIKLI